LRQGFSTQPRLALSLQACLSLWNTEVTGIGCYAWLNCRTSFVASFLCFFSSLGQILEKHQVKGGRSHFGSWFQPIVRGLHALSLSGGWLSRWQRYMVEHSRSPQGAREQRQTGSGQGKLPLESDLRDLVP
jgi:hypothetical protein